MGETMTDDDKLKFMEAAQLCDIHALESALKNVDDIDMINYDGYSALHEVLQRGDLECARLLIEKGANTKLEDEDRSLPLHLAARGHNPACVQLIMDHGTPIDRQNRYGDTPLHEAVWGSAFACIKLLIENGADAEIENSHGRTPMVLSIDEGRRESMCFLIELGVDIKKMRYANSRVIDYAKSHGWTDVVAACEKVALKAASKARRDKLKDSEAPGL